MSHDETSGTATRKERRKAFGGTRQAAPRYIFSAAAHVRKDWGPEDLIESLERRAHGYNGLLRNYLCTAAALIRHQTGVITGYRDQAVSEAVEAEAAAPVVPKRTTSDPSPSGKRNQQPGRLSGSEREALKKFAALVARAGASKILMDEAMVEGRKMLAKVRKRALGDRADLVVEELEDLPKDAKYTDAMIRAGEVGA